MEQGMNPAFLRTLEVVLEGRWGGRIMLFVMIPVLLLASILLPPVSFAERVLAAGHTEFTKAGGSLLDPDGTRGRPPLLVTFTAQLWRAFCARVPVMRRVGPSTHLRAHHMRRHVVLAPAMQCSPSPCRPAVSEQEKRVERPSLC